MNFWHALGEQLKHPHGLMGRIVGHAMCVVNKAPNRQAVKALNIRPDDRVLELGFGPGQAVAMMARHITEGIIYGIDASGEMLVQAQKRNSVALKEGKVRLATGDFPPLSFDDQSLDKILAVNVMYFWRDAPAILAECHRVLRPGGKIVIYVTDAASMQNWKFADRDTHILYTQDDVRVALLQGGFEPNKIKIKTINVMSGVTGIVAITEK